MRSLAPRFAARALGVSAVAIVSSLAAPSSTALPRTWVSTTGVDTGNCSRTAPCRTFTYAITQVDAGGEVDVLDSGGYGQMTIAKAVIVNVPPGLVAGIVASSAAGVTVSAGPEDRVVLRGLTITANPSRHGIAANSFGALHVENCVLNGPGGLTGFPTGLLITPAAAAEVHLKDVIVRNFATGVAVGAAAPVQVQADRLRSQDNETDGFFAGSNARVLISNSVLSGNSVGLTTYSSTAATTASAVVEYTVLSSNATGVFGYSDAGGAVDITLSNSSIAQNGTGVSIVSFAGSSTVVYTRTNNTFARNGVDVAGGALTPLAAK